MLLGVHIVSALASLSYSTYVALAPSKRKLNISYLLILETIISGVLLGFVREVNVAQACLSGFAYLGFVLTTTLFAKRQIFLSKS